MPVIATECTNGVHRPNMAKPNGTPHELMSLKFAYFTPYVNIGGQGLSTAPVCQILFAIVDRVKVRCRPASRCRALQ